MPTFNIILQMIYHIYIIKIKKLYLKITNIAGIYMTTPLTTTNHAPHYPNHPPPYTGLVMGGHRATSVGGGSHTSRLPSTPTRGVRRRTSRQCARNRPFRHPVQLLPRGVQGRRMFDLQRGWYRVVGVAAGAQLSTFQVGGRRGSGGHV